jgi:hypothetical protein
MHSFADHLHAGISTPSVSLDLMRGAQRFMRYCEGATPRVCSTSLLAPAAAVVERAVCGSLCSNTGATGVHRRLYPRAACNGTLLTASHLSLGGVNRGLAIRPSGRGRQGSHELLA